MKEYVQLATDVDVDVFRAETWVRFYEDALARIAVWRDSPVATLPRSYVAAGRPVPTYGEPLDWLGYVRRFVWLTQTPHGQRVYPIDGGGALVVLSPGRGGGTTRVRRLLQGASAVNILEASELVPLRTLRPDPTAARARALLGLRGPARVVPVLRDPATLVARAALTGPFADKAAEVEGMPDPLAAATGRLFL